MPAPRVTIDELPEQITPLDTDLIVVQDGDTTKKMTMAVLSTVASDSLEAHLVDPVAAHAASAISAIPNTYPMSGTDVQTQLGQIASVLASTASGADEVWVGNDEPTNPVIELWYDPDAVPTGTPGLLDGDKGDIVVSDAGATWVFDAEVVTAMARTLLDDETAEEIRETLGVTGAGGGVTDGDKGDIGVFASGATWLLDPSVVTTAARTVLDDASTAEMRTTLGIIPMVVSATEPVAADYGLATIPVGAVWIETEAP